MSFPSRPIFIQLVPEHLPVAQQLALLAVLDAVGRAAGGAAEGLWINIVSPNPSHTNDTLLMLCVQLSVHWSSTNVCGRPMN